MDLLTPDLGLFIWNLLAFLILFFILKKTAWKPILKSLNEREKGISDSLATAEKVKAEMAQLKSDPHVAALSPRKWLDRYFASDAEEPDLQWHDGPIILMPHD